MIVSLDEVSASSTDVTRDVCIVGSGPAGISLARKLASLGVDVFLAEGGGFNLPGKFESCYEGEYIGDANYSMAWQRRRYFGGSSNCWGGWCRPLDSIDFDRSDIADHCVWPISPMHLAPYLTEASEILDIRGQFGPIDLPDSEFKQIQFQFSEYQKQTNPRPTRFREKYADELDKSKSITLCVDANLIDGCFYKSQAVKYLTFKSSNGKYINVAAKNFVFAMGGIENPRYLLWFYERLKGEFSQLNLPVGQYWMDHPHYRLGDVIYFNSLADQVPSIKTDKYGPSGHSYFALNPRALKSLGILNGGLRLKLQGNQGGLVDKILEEFTCMAPALAERLSGRENLCVYECLFAYEQLPDERNRMELDSTNVDLLGIPKVRIFSKKGIQDALTLRRTTVAFNDWLVRSDIGRMRLDPWLSKGLLEDSDPIAYPVPFYAGHHMGGTRMSDSPKTGVVDENCRVHGYSNLFMAGSSCFPTGGHSNPTLTIVQLSLRLADHLATRI